MFVFKFARYILKIRFVCAFRARNLCRFRFYTENRNTRPKHQLNVRFFQTEIYETKSGYTFKKNLVFCNLNIFLSVLFVYEIFYIDNLPHVSNMSEMLSLPLSFQYGGGYALLMVTYNHIRYMLA